MWAVGALLVLAGLVGVGAAFLPEGYHNAEGPASDSGNLATMRPFFFIRC